MSGKKVEKSQKRDPYKNLRISEKLQLVEEFLKTPEPQNISAFATKYNLSKRTFYRWVTSYKNGSLKAVPNNNVRCRVRAGYYAAVEDQLVR